MKDIILPILTLVFIIFLAACDLGVDYGGYFYSYSTPDSRFEERNLLPMPSDPTALASLPLSGGKQIFSFAVISDIHTRGSDVSHLNQFVDTLLEPEDEFILDCGDSTQSGYASQFNTYKTIMNNRGLPWFSTIGNHDLYHEGWKFYRSIIGRTSYSFSIGNSSDPGSTYIIALDSANSSLGRKQLMWLERTLKEQKGLWDHMIVFTHSQFFSTGINTFVQFTDTEEIYKLMYLFKTYNVDYVFMGHNHRWDKRTIEGVNYLALDPLQKEGSDDSFVRVSIDGTDIGFERIMIPGL